MSYPTRVWTIAVAALAVAASGSSAQTVASDLVVSSDAELAALAAELLPQLATRSGMELREPVRLERRSREELVRYLTTKMDEELSEEEARATVQAYALLGLVPADFDLRAMLMALYTEQVAGFYEPDSTALFVMDDQADEDLESLLLHELVHAVQDQTVDLDRITDPELGNDRARAAQAAIEGHATLIMFEYMIERDLGQAVDLSRLPGFGPMLRQGLEGARDQFAVLATAPRVLQESLIFPYIEGAAYLQGRWALGSRIVPFGDELPLSTDAILSPGTAAPPIEVMLRAPGATAVHDDVLGRLELGLLLDEHLGPEYDVLAEGWGGDRYVLFELADGTRVLEHVVVWRDDGARDRFVAAWSGRMDGFGSTATIRATSVDGHAASRLSVGAADVSSLAVSTGTR